MFEKEAEEKKPPYACCTLDTNCELWKDGFQKGAELGYNKANEWHYPSKGELPKEDTTEKEEKIMFHTLGYDYQPRWNDDKGSYRNWFGIYPSEDNGDYIAVKSLVEKGFMQKDGTTAWKEEVYSVTDKGKAYVVDLWLKKRKEAKSSRSKRRSKNEI